MIISTGSRSRSVLSVPLVTQLRRVNLGVSGAIGSGVRHLGGPSSSYNAGKVKVEMSGIVVNPMNAELLPMRSLQRYCVAKVLADLPRQVCKSCSPIASPFYIRS